MAAVNNKVSKVLKTLNRGVLVFLQGHCYVWALSSGEPKESSKLLPKNKILAHEGRSGLKFNAEA